jgi:hypothetical protein
VSPCYAYRDLNGRSEAQYIEELKNELDAEIRALGPENVAGFFAEPVVGAVSPSLWFDIPKAATFSFFPYMYKHALISKKKGTWLRSSTTWLFEGYARRLPIPWRSLHLGRSNVRLRAYWLHACISTA